ncbi:DnaD domain protein [Marinicrinis lubricantis]|uniref:DnaD domain protein n=1 Tax=Marinicrinis lubricantis TaxID=2086470 RepID=A0ABW1IUK9_9BACL
MRISNLLHFTENHRFYMFRDFSLSPLEYKMLQWIYQPMIGPTAISLFLLLYEQVPAERIGYSRLEQQRRLFLSMALEPSEKGRKQLIESASKLEALGLLQSSRQYISEQDEYIYAYRLHKPLSPYEFFKNDHLLLLLRDKIGKHAVLSLHNELCCTAEYPWNTESVQQEDISTPFYELFQLNTNTIDFELEQALLESASGIIPFESQNSEETLDYGEMMRRFPRTSSNRVWVERLKYAPEQLSKLHYLTMKYQLSISRLCSLLDEDFAFNAQGELQYEALEHAAHLTFRQMKKREEDRTVWLNRSNSNAEDKDEAPREVEMQYYVDVPAAITKQVDVHQYNRMLKNQPYTKILDLFFPGNVPDSVLNTFSKIDLNYRLKEEVINLLIHYIKNNDFSWSKPYIDAIASDMLGRQIDSFEKAVEYIRAQENRTKQPKAAGSKTSRSRRNAHQKPKLEVYQGEASGSFNEEAYQRGLQLAELLDEKNKRQS